MKSNVGYSTLENAFEAGKETALKAQNNLKKTKIGMLYTSVDYNQEEVIKGVQSVMKDIPFIGCTSSGGIIVPDGIITSDHGFAGMLTIEEESMIVGIAGSPLKKDARETGRMVAYEALENAGADFAPSYYYMVASPKEEESYVKGIQDVIGDVPFFGGSAADNTISGDWKIICNDQSFSDGVAVAFFYTEKPIETVYTGAYKESKNVGIITKVKNDRNLIEIDGVPALKKYAEWTGASVNDLMGSNLLVASVTKPLGVKESLGDLIAIRHPMAGNDDYSISLGNKVVENTAIIQMESTVDELISSTGKTLNEVNKKLKNPGAYFLVHCGGRKVGIGDRLEEVYNSIKSVTKDVPFITIFTFGEYGYNEHSRNTCGGLMLSFTGFDKEE
ncbi:MAG: FIST N-terminal domain-containing protein [Bacilli bacterium]